MCQGRTDIHAYLQHWDSVGSHTQNIAFIVIVVVDIKLNVYHFICVCRHFNVSLKCKAAGYTEHHFVGWCRQVGWDAAWQWLVEILPASSAGSLLVVHSHSLDRQTLYSKERRSEELKETSRTPTGTMTAHI